MIYSCILLRVSTANSAEIKKFTQQEWEKISEEADTWVDYRGFPLDPKIRELVIALNAVGVVTSASREGHLTREKAYPWIDIDLQTDESRLLKEQEEFVWQELKKEEELFDEKFPGQPADEWLFQPNAQLQKLREEWSDLRHKIKQINLTQLENLHLLLKRFYQTHQTSYDSLIFLSLDWMGAVRLRNMGSDLQQVRSKEEKKIKLREYQNEMENLANFIKANFHT